MKSIRMNAINELDNAVNKAVNTGKPVFVLFFGTELPETSQSWCPDCVIADPLIRKALSDKDVILLEVPVGNRDEWKGKPDHPYRVKYQIPAIPTLCKWTANGRGNMLVEDDCADWDRLEQFVSS
ncbi:hypothetical protein BDB01DRAFT_771335 [Pilobolus umbonatus]|nr:hypothetical protein BDB01DRAFT_771335 [Pilobolus umbonatus]